MAPLPLSPECHLLLKQLEDRAPWLLRRGWAWMWESVRRELLRCRALLVLAGAEIMQGTAPKTNLERKLEKLIKKGAKPEQGGA